MTQIIHIHASTTHKDGTPQYPSKDAVFIYHMACGATVESGVAKSGTNYVPSSAPDGATRPKCLAVDAGSESVAMEQPNNATLAVELESLKAYMLVEQTNEGLKIMSHWDTLAEAVRNRYYNSGRHESDRRIYIFKSVTWHEEFTEVISEPTIKQEQDR